MRPGNTLAAGILLICGAGWSLMMAIGVSIGSLGAWFPAYCFCFPLAVFALVIGIILVSGARVGHVLPVLAGVAETLQFMDCDVIGATCGIIAIVVVSQGDSVAYLNGVDTAAPGYEGPVPVPRKASAVDATGLATGPGLLLNSSFFPLAFLLFLTRPAVVIDGIEQRVAWGRQFLPLAPGWHDLHIYTPYIGHAARAQISIEVHDGYLTPLDYRVPFIVYMAGVLTPHPPQPVAAQLPPPVEPAPPAPPAPPGTPTPTFPPTTPPQG